MKNSKNNTTKKSNPELTANEKAEIKNKAIAKTLKRGKKVETKKTSSKSTKPIVEITEGITGKGLKKQQDAKTKKEQKFIDHARKAIEDGLKVDKATKKDANTDRKKRPIKNPGVITTILTIITNAKPAVCKTQILAELVKQFADRDEKGMKNTINCQLGGKDITRMEKEKEVKFIISIDPETGVKFFAIK